MSEDDKPTMNDRLDKNYFGRLVTSGLNTPVDVFYEGNAIDIIDTIRITLRPIGSNKIKEYYGRWKKKSDDDGLHIRPDGSRYRDIIVHTKTVHYSDTLERLVLSPVASSYMFSPMKDAEKILHFTLAKERYRRLLDTEGNELAEEILSSRDTTSLLHITTAQCRFTTGGASSSYFNIEEEKTLAEEFAYNGDALNAINAEGGGDTASIEKQILEMMNEPEKFKDQLDGMVNAYNTGDKDALLKIFTAEGARSSADAGRNARFLEVAEKALADGGRTLIAIGVYHIIAEDGLFNTLTQAGYTVEAL